jgi:hypothetical protein
MVPTIKIVLAERKQYEIVKKWKKDGDPLQ